MPPWIESKNCNVNFTHDRAQQSGRFKGAETLETQSFAERINFEEDFAQCVARVGSARADRVVALAECCEEIRQGMQGPNSGFSPAENENCATANDENR